MVANVTLQGWTLVIEWTSQRKTIAIGRGTLCECQTVKNAILHVMDHVDESAAKRLFLSILTAA
jgi:hypothetical protein